MEYGAVGSQVVTARIAILVEGATEGAFQKPLRTFLESRLSGNMPKLDFQIANGRIPTQDTLKRVVLRLLTHQSVI